MHIDNYYSIYIQIEIIYKYICNKHTFSFINIHNQAQCFHSSGLVIRKGHLGIGNKNDTSHRVLGIRRGEHQPQITDIRITTGRDKTSYDAGLFCFVNIK